MLAQATFKGLLSTRSCVSSRGCHLDAGRQLDFGFLSLRKSSFWMLSGSWVWDVVACSQGSFLSTKRIRKPEGSAALECWSCSWNMGSSGFKCWVQQIANLRLLKAPRIATGLSIKANIWHKCPRTPLLPHRFDQWFTQQKVGSHFTLYEVCIWGLYRCLISDKCWSLTASISLNGSCM